jgi:predicted nucleic acid-binding protein
VILVDTSVWIDHLRSGVPALAQMLERGEALVHPFVIGEIALGNLRQRSLVLMTLSRLPRATVATEGEVLRFIEERALFGRGVGYVDAHLLAAARLTAEASFWTYDKQLHEIADELGLAASR